MRPRVFSPIAALFVLEMAATADAQVRVSALLSMVARNEDAPLTSHTTNFGATPFDATYARLFVDATISDRLSAFLQWFAHSYDGAFFYGGYIRYDHTPNTHLEAGLIPVPVGIWAPRTYADKNPLVSVPAIYQYKTSMSAFGSLQKTNAEILDQRGLGENSPILYDFCWNTGVHAYGSTGPFDFGIALLNGSLGVPRRAIVFTRPNLAAHASWMPSPYFTVGVWGSGGPYLSPGMEASLPVGNRVEDFNQLIAGGHVQVATGHFEFVSEGIANRFEHPFLGDLESLGGYADARYTFATRWWAAARIDGISFSRLSGADGACWDYPLVRFEGGIGRRLTERALVKAVAQLVRYQEGPESLDGEVYALQFTVEL